jgi:hypothetical protein
MADNHHRFGHEERDVNIYAITKFGIGLTLVVIATVFLIWGMFHFFSQRVRAEFPVAPETRTKAEVKLPPSPRLQENPRIDLRAIRADEERLLHGYGWANQETGAVRIPIERAMDLLVQRGLPARPQNEGIK